MNREEELRAKRLKKDHEAASRILIRSRYEPTTQEQIEWALHRGQRRQVCRDHAVRRSVIALLLVGVISACCTPPPPRLDLRKRAAFLDACAVMASGALAGIRDPEDRKLFLPTVVQFNADAREITSR